jgi:hypothetical protein
VRDRLAVQNDTRREQLVHDDTKFRAAWLSHPTVGLYGTTSATKASTFGTIGDIAMQKARRSRTGPDLQPQMVAGVGIEPTTFGL